MVVLLLLLLIGLSAVSSHYLAKKQGRATGFWGVMGIVFAPITPFVLLFLKSKNKG